jgi:hypothetical protein
MSDNGDSGQGSSLRDISAGLLGFLLIVLFFLGGVWIVWRVISSMEGEVAAALVTASATALVSVFGIVYNKRWDRKRQIREEHRKKKIPVYEEFMEFWFEILTATKTGEEISEEEMLNSMIDFTHHVMIWGSDDFVKSFGHWKTTVGSLEDAEGSHEVEQLGLFEDLVLAMRRDLGHKNEGFERGDFLRLFITDIDDYLD